MRLDLALCELHNMAAEHVYLISYEILKRQHAETETGFCFDGDGKVANDDTISRFDEINRANDLRSRHQGRREVIRSRRTVFVVSHPQMFIIITYMKSRCQLQSHSS